MEVWQLENEAEVNKFRAEVGLKLLESLTWENAETREYKPNDS